MHKDKPKAKPKYKVGQQVRFVKAKPPYIDTSMRFMVISVDNNLFMDGMFTYEVVNERIGPVTVDEEEIKSA